MDLFQTRLKLDNRELNRSLAALRANSRRLPSYLANKACRSISYNAWRLMPRTSPATVATELNQAVALIKSRNSPAGAIRWRKGGAFQRANRVFGSLGSARAFKAEYADVPLLALIINASVNPASRYNSISGGVYARDASPFKGKSRAAGAQAMLETMRRVFSARLTSTGFFAACARAVNVGFSMALGKMGGFGNLPASEGDPLGGSGLNKASKLLSRGLATIKPAFGDRGNAEFSVATTEADTKGKPGHALENKIAPVWQRAIDAEAASVLSEAQRRYTAAARAAGITVQ